MPNVAYPPKPLKLLVQASYAVVCRLLCQTIVFIEQFSAVASPYYYVIEVRPFFGRADLFSLSAVGARHGSSSSRRKKVDEASTLWRFGWWVLIGPASGGAPPYATAPCASSASLVGVMDNHPCCGHCMDTSWPAQHETRELLELLRADHVIGNHIGHEPTAPPRVAGNEALSSRRSNRPSRRVCSGQAGAPYPQLIMRATRGKWREIRYASLIRSE
jgi:hypothetical protein